MTADAVASTLELADTAEPEAPRASAVRQSFVLKQGDTFLVADAVGDLHGADDGLFHDDTRVLSKSQLKIGGRPPFLLGSGVSRDNVFFTAHITNLPLPPLGGHATPEGVIHLERKRLLWEDRLYERLRFVSYGRGEVLLPLSLTFDADFFDTFEVRGQRRAARGRLWPAEVAGDRIVLRYGGLDGVPRATWIAFSQPPNRLAAGKAGFVLRLSEAASHDLYMEISVTEAERPSCARFRAAAARARWATRTKRRRAARPDTPNPLFNEWIERSQADLALLTTELSTGPYPYAGIPWFSTPFGRDAVITALQTLWLAPDLARGVLRFLAANQANQTSTFQDSAPGKIIHETRKGEMTTLRELPFGRYYGGVDTTPLFVVLAGAYTDRTGDLAFVDELWPALQAAIGWAENIGATNPDGFLHYARGEESGLSNQGWKDSHDAVFHADGRIPVGPIALVEVQGYFHAALSTMARLAERRQEIDAAEHWRQRAARLRQSVEDRFWMEDAGFYGIAIDGERMLCRVRASNAGHLLYTGTAAPDRAASVAEQLMSSAFNTGWGLRTLANSEIRYNPMSYHNGSVWPHDTALCAAGIAHYGRRGDAVRLLNKMFEAAVYFGMRLPELFCGFERSNGDTPIPYPIACLPQAWAAGSVFMILQACLGITIDGWGDEIRLDNPRLPAGMERLSIRQLLVGETRADITFERARSRVVAFAEGPDRGGLTIRS